MTMETLSLTTLPAWIWFCAAFVVMVALGWGLARLLRGKSPPHESLTNDYESPSSGVSATESTEVVGPMVRFRTILFEYKAQKRALEKRTEIVDRRIADLNAHSYESLAIEELLRSATPQERATLIAVLKLPEHANTEAIDTELRIAGSHSMASATRRIFRKAPYVEYLEILEDVGKKFRVDSTQHRAIHKIEQAIAVNAFQKMLNEATPEERERVLSQLSADQQRFARGVGAAAGTLVLANLSGFGLYVAASSALGAVTGALGIALPFAAYTGMSSMIATLIGPVGWVALGFFAASTLGKENYKKTIPSVLAIASLRLRLIAERDHERETLNAERDGVLRRMFDQVVDLSELLDEMIAGKIRSVPLDRVPR